MSSVTVAGEHLSLMLSAIGSLDNQLSSLHAQLQRALGSGAPVPEDARQLRERLIRLQEALIQAHNSRLGAELPLEFAAVLKSVLLRERRNIAAEIDAFRRNTQNPEMLAALDARLAPFRHYAAAGWFKEAEPERIPKAEDYLTPHYLDSQHPPVPIQSRQYDPKHGVFLSAAQLWADLPPLRSACDSRRACVTILFIDVDDFKNLNSTYGEPHVDRDLLPTLMRIIEEAFYGHALVYRYGGDEFVAVAPNTPRPVLLPLIRQLRVRLAAADYPNIMERPTVSIGVCELLPNSATTEDEALALASAAKRFAKQEGKNATAGLGDEDTAKSRFSLWESEGMA
jgi:diguanylate cyclase (GGDEF)-like protein